jgi:hypothetical protein
MGARVGTCCRALTGEATIKIVITSSACIAKAKRQMEARSRALQATQQAAFETQVPDLECRKLLEMLRRSSSSTERLPKVVVYMNVG